MTGPIRLADVVPNCPAFGAFTNPLSLLLECTHLMECRQPVLAVPSSDNPSVLEFMDIDGLDGHFPVLRRKAHERRLMRAGELGTNDDLVSVSKNLQG